MRTSSEPRDRMPQTTYTEQLATIYKMLHRLIEEGRKLRRDLRMVVNVHKYTRARLELLAAYRGVTLKGSGRGKPFLPALLPPGEGACK